MSALNSQYDDTSLVNSQQFQLSPSPNQTGTEFKPVATTVMDLIPEIHNSTPSNNAYEAIENGLQKVQIKKPEPDVIGDSRENVSQGASPTQNLHEIKENVRPPKTIKELIKQTSPKESNADIDSMLQP